MNNTSEPTFKTYYGNCLKSEQPILKKHILKMCAGTCEELSELTDEKTPNLCVLVVLSIM